MVPAVLDSGGRRLRYAVSNNVRAYGPDGPGSPPVWAVNIHGYFAGGGMYWRESALLAEMLGWRVVNPSLPGFAGSDPLPWEQVSISNIAGQVGALMDHLGIDQAVLLGHSMGGAVAIEMASAYPDRVLGVVYRDGAATPAWKKRHSLLTSSLQPVAPDLAGIADLVLAVVLDFPDLLFGRRIASTFRSVWPDARRNVRAFGRTIPVGSMLMALDLSDKVVGLASSGRIPLLPVWGCFDRVANAATAAEFSDLTGLDILWVPGGHSWMLARPQSQADILRFLEPGRSFLEQVDARQRSLMNPTKDLSRRGLHALSGK
ncbi:MAG: alpha/beta hydrolase [Actinomycetota bacterium]|nr:alpha/beta hydrolase [Actinomycetota bacterium]